MKKKSYKDIKKKKQQTRQWEFGSKRDIKA